MAEAIDTFEIADDLEAAGIEPERAKAHARAHAKAIAQAVRQSRSDLATKTDLAELKVELIKWNVGVVVGVVGLATAVLGTLIALT